MPPSRPELTPTCRPPPRPWAAPGRPPISPTPRGPRSMTSCTPSTPACTTISGAAGTRSCTASAQSSERTGCYVTINELSALVCALHAELVRNHLVTWTSGNVSARVPGQDLMVIKPSGVAYDDLTPSAMVVCDLDGAQVSEGLSPSSDTASHAYIYRSMPTVGGVVHTH